MLQNVVLISFREWLHSYSRRFIGFRVRPESSVLISFREWLHSYPEGIYRFREMFSNSSHLFQRVASFLHVGFVPWGPAGSRAVLISFREWLHSYPET